MVVLGVTDADNVVRRESQLIQGSAQAGGLVDSRRQHHHRALVEDYLMFQPQITDGLENQRLIRMPGGDDHAANRKWGHALRLERRDERRRRWLGQRQLLARGRGIDQRAVLSYHAIEQIYARECAQQIGQLTAGDQDQLAAGCA